jgi:hypothetical protein
MSFFAAPTPWPAFVPVDALQRKSEMALDVVLKAP